MHNKHTSNQTALCPLEQARKPVCFLAFFSVVVCVIERLGTMCCAAHRLFLCTVGTWYSSFVLPARVCVRGSSALFACCWVPLGAVDRWYYCCCNLFCRRVCVMHLKGPGDLLLCSCSSVRNLENRDCGLHQVQTCLQAVRGWKCVTCRLAF